MKERQRIRLCGVLSCLTVVIGAVGCDEKDKQVRQMASEAMTEQGGQNRAMAALNRDVAIATRRTAEEQAKARQSYVEAQKQLQTQRNELDRQRDGLEDERRQLAHQRHRDPIIAAMVYQLGLLIACLSPLVVCWVLLHRGGSEPSDAALNELLVEDLVAEEPVFLPRSAVEPKAISDHGDADDFSYPGEFDDG